MERLRPKAVIPTHHLCHPTTITLSTLQVADEWVDSHQSRQRLPSGSLELAAAGLARMGRKFLYFGDNIVSS